MVGNMAGIRPGLLNKIILNPEHYTNTAMAMPSSWQDTLKSIKVMEKRLETADENTKVINKSCDFSEIVQVLMLCNAGIFVAASADMKDQLTIYSPCHLKNDLLLCVILILVMTATYTTGERSFSAALRGLKTFWLALPQAQQRLNRPSMAGRRRLRLHVVSFPGFG